MFVSALSYTGSTKRCGDESVSVQEVPPCYQAKTKETKTSFTTYLAGIGGPERRQDCRALAAMMKRATGCPPRVWGTSIVGFGQYHYRSASGHEGDSCLVGFASRKPDLTLYLMPGFEQPAVRKLLDRLGKHKTGKGCLYIRRMADVDLAALEELITRSVSETRSRGTQNA